jgi:hypothetical protein
MQWWLCPGFLNTPWCSTGREGRKPADPPEITPDAAQHFLADWSFAHAPVEAIALGTP